MDKRRGTFHVCGLSDEEAEYEMQCRNERGVFNLPSKVEERRYIITSTIRMLAMIDFSEKMVSDMYHASKKLRKIESDGGVVTDGTLYHMYIKEQRGK